MADILRWILIFHSRKRWARNVHRREMIKRSVAILLVEDDPVWGPVTVELLCGCGHAPALAASFDEAFTLLVSPHRIELLILDLQLSANRGDVLIESLRSANAKVPPIIVLSAQPVPELMRVAEAVGAQAFLQKPCSVQGIMDAIERAVLRRRRQSSIVQSCGMCAGSLEPAPQFGRLRPWLYNRPKD